MSLFEEQKKFPNLGKLSYDFWLPKSQTLIEYQGAQHYEPINCFGGEEKYKIQIEHDRLKREYALKNNYTLIEISYKDFDNIETILLNIFNNPDKLENMKSKARLIAKKNSTQNIVETLLG